jgi:hypothetical protein
MVVELATDPYVPRIGGLAGAADGEEALPWIRRRCGRLAEGIGLSSAIADAKSDVAVGAIGLWLQNLSTGRATARYLVSPAHRDHTGLTRGHFRRDPANHRREGSQSQVRAVVTVASGLTVSG